MTTTAKDGPGPPDEDLLELEELVFPSEWTPEEKAAKAAQLLQKWRELAVRADKSLPGLAAVSAYAWIQLYAEQRQDPDNWIFALARVAIQIVPREEETTDAVDRLARELLTRTRAAAEGLGIAAWAQAVTPDSPEGPHLSLAGLEDLAREHAGADESKPKGGLLPLTARAAAILYNIGPEGRRQAERLREAARRRWAGRAEDPAGIWQPWSHGKHGPIRFWLLLARATWVDVVQAEDRYAPALATPVLHALAKLTRPGTAEVRGLHVTDPKGRAVWNADPGKVETLALARRGGPNVTDAVLSEVLRDTARALQSLAGQRLLRYLVREGARTLGTRERDEVRLRVEGGYDRLVKVTGGKKPAMGAQLRDALAALEVLRISSPDHGLAAAWLLAFDEWTPRPGRPAVVEVLLNWPLLPTGAAKLRAESRLLVPVLPLPALVGRPRGHAAQGTMHLRMMLHFSERSRELVEQGGLVLHERDWHKLADESGVPAALVSKVRDAYHKGQDLLPPVLRPVDAGRDLVTLHDDRARKLLEEQGAHRETQRKRRRRGK